MRVSVANSGRSFSVAPDQPVLEAALRAGLNLPHVCKGGSCGVCRARLLQGKVRYPNGMPLGLSAVEAADGLILLCQARADTDVRIDILEMRSAGISLIKRLPSRIERMERLAPDVMRVFLRLPAAESFSFEAGQYVDILLPEGRRRAFSIASPPHEADLLELHMRRVPGGLLTERLFDHGVGSGILHIEGPLGRFVYRERRAPMLLIGGGTGLAPLNSMVRHVIDKALGRDMWLYWGVGSERDLYAHAQLEALASRASNFRYVPVLFESGTGWTGRRGRVDEAALHDLDKLRDPDVYASGPPAMIAAVRREFRLRGIADENLFFDPFDYAQDF